MNKIQIEKITYKGIHYADVIWSNTVVDKTTFYSPSNSSFQFGLLAHKKGFVEPPHYHKAVKRVVLDLQQMFVVQKGIVVVELYSDSNKLIREIRLKKGDAIVLIHGIHAIRVEKDMQCISVKQGPFMGTENDKILVEVKK